jgi:tetratricopeptide (TPR) repeat protein
MSKLASLFLLVVSLLVSRTATASETSPRPLRQTELLALVAGNALPENIVNEIRTRGVAFRLDDSFRAQLTTVGATPSILAALGAAKAPAKVAAEDKPDPALLQHIAAAAKLMQEKHYDEAADELTSTLKGNFEKFEIGFVMGELLRRQERWGQAAAVYAEVLRQDPSFPEAHTKLSYVLYHVGDREQALREAKTALARTPENAEAHLYAGIALDEPGKFDAALAEYKEALRLKPDYTQVHYTLGVSLYDNGDKGGSVAEYRKALALDPTHINARYNLANVLHEMRDFPAAIREFREAKRYDPHRFDVRMNLSNALIDDNMVPQAIVELRELEGMASDSAMCHQCLGHALHLVADFKGAEKEYHMAAELDPSDASIRLGLGAVYEDQNRYDAALEEYRHAETLDENSAHVHRNLGRVLLAMRNVGEALKELKQAEDLAPGEGAIHEYYAQALQLSGDMNAAVAEFKEAVAINPKEIGVRLELATALEKTGDWVASLEQYRQAALADNIDATPNQPGVGKRQYDAPKKYTEAQERFHSYVASLKSAGKSAEAAKLEDSVRGTQAATGDSEKLDLTMQAGSQAFAEKRFDDAERNYKEAVQLAEKLQKPDARLVTALGHLGQLTMYRKDFAGAQAAFERQLKVTEQVYGSQSPATSDPLKWMAFNATAQQDFASAQKYFDRALDVNRKAYGENSVGYAEVLRSTSGVYIYQKAYDKAERYLIEASDIEQRLYGNGGQYGPFAFINLGSLCSLYDTWGKPEKLDPCDRRLIAAIEKQYGPNTAFLEQTLTREAKTLRTLGRAAEAAQVEQRLKSLQPSAAVNPN